MISKSDWQDAYRDLLEEGRKRVGPPPAVEDVEALLRGELSELEAQRVRELLTYYPEMARAMTAPFPTKADGVLTDAEREADFAKIRKRLSVAPPPVVPFPSRTFALAAGVVIAVAIAGFALVQRLQREPRPVERKILIADGDRGAGSRGASAPSPITLSTASDYALKLVFRPMHAYREYSFELFYVDATPPRSMWKKDGVERQADGAYPIELSTEDLTPGRYELVLYGLDGEARRLATYTLRIDAP